jgi:hypothetical protein
MAKFQSRVITSGNGFDFLYNYKAYDSRLPLSWPDPYVPSTQPAEAKTPTGRRAAATPAVEPVPDYLR